MKTRLMGILNVTPDSCFDGGRYFELKTAIARGEELCQQGADIIDIGGESTRPGASPVSVEEEKRRVLPLIEELQDRVSIPLSIDTRNWEVAAAAIERGVSMVNDITGFVDPQMCEVVATSSVDLCVMHMQGTPQTMQQAPYYPEGVVVHLLSWFESRVEALQRIGIAPERIYLDPGIGFGKSVAHNLEIIHNLPRFKSLGFPILIGLSRKSFMGKITHKSYAELLPETLAMNTVACLASVDVIRVHDVSEHRAVIDLITAYLLPQ